MLRFLSRLVLILGVVLILALISLRLAAALRENQIPESDAPAPGAFIETESVAFYAQSAGPPDGIPVLLAHGTAAWSGFWAKEVALIGNHESYRAIAFDMPPFGYSIRPQNTDYSRTAQAGRILDLVATLNTPPIMVAHSFGAAAATEAVLRDPTAFAGLIIVDGALGMTADPVAKSLPLPLRQRVLREAAVSASVTNPWATKTLLRGLLHRKDAATDDYIDVLQMPYDLSGTTSAYADWLPALLAPATDSLSRDPAQFADLPLPVRLIWGDKDTVTPPAQAEAIAAALGQADVIYLKDVGHIPHIEAPEAFAQVLLKLLDEIAQAR